MTKTIFIMHSLLVTVLFPITLVADDSACGNLFSKHCSETKALAGITCDPATIIDRISALIKQETAPKEKIERMNQDTLADLSSTPIPLAVGKRKHHLPKDDINALYDRVASHPVASLQHYNRYDPYNTGVGYCFGRAMTAHLEALWGSHLNNSSIRKIWAVGNLESGGAQWRYHVATIVRGQDGYWWTIDPIFQRPLKASDWLREMKGMNPDGFMRVYITEAKRFGPEANDAYRTNELNRRDYHSFFMDLLGEYRRVQEPLPVATRPL